MRFELTVGISDMELEDGRVVLVAEVGVEPEDKVVAFNEKRPCQLLEIYREGDVQLVRLWAHGYTATVPLKDFQDAIVRAAESI
jgi:hypothetical protein